MGYAIGFLVALVIFLLPVLLIACSDKAHGRHKLGWVLISLAGLPIGLVVEALGILLLRSSQSMFGYLAIGQLSSLLFLGIGWLTLIVFHSRTRPTNPR